MAVVNVTVPGSPTAAINAAGGTTTGLAGAAQAQNETYAAYKARLAASVGAPPPAIAQFSAADLAAKRAQAAVHDAIMAIGGGDYTNTAVVAAADQASQQTGMVALNHAIAHGASTDPNSGFVSPTSGGAKAPDLQLSIDTDTGNIVGAQAVAKSALQKLLALGGTAAGATVGALAGGPVGFAIGAAAGGALDLLRARSKKA